MLNYLDDDQAAAVELKEPLFFVAVIRGAQKTSTGIRFKKTNEHLVVASKHDDCRVAPELAQELVEFACRVTEMCDHSVSVSLTDGYLGVCLSRKRSGHKKSIRAAGLLVSRASGGDFDFRAVVEEGQIKDISKESLADLCGVLGLQVMCALASGYDVTL